MCDMAIPNESQTSAGRSKMLFGKAWSIVSATDRGAFN